MFLDERRAVNQLCSSIRTGIAYKSLSEAGVPLTVEPFFRSVIAAVYYDHLNALLKRSRIKLDPRKARLMMGVMDVTGILQYGQVSRIVSVKHSFGCHLMLLLNSQAYTKHFHIGRLYFNV